MNSYQLEYILDFEYIVEFESIHLICPDRGVILSRSQGWNWKKRSVRANCVFTNRRRNLSPKRLLNEFFMFHGSLQSQPRVLKKSIYSVQCTAVCSID